MRILFLEFEYFELPDPVVFMSCPGNSGSGCWQSEQRKRDGEGKPGEGQI